MKCLGTSPFLLLEIVALIPYLFRTVFLGLNSNYLSIDLLEINNHGLYTI